MSAYADVLARRENTPEKMVARNQCPKCSGDLDTGWECTSCGFDAMPIATAALEGGAADE